MPLLKTAPLCVLAFAAMAAPLPAYANASGDSVAPVPENKQSSLDLAGKIVAIGYPEDAREAMFFGSMDQLVVQMRSSLADYMPENDPAAVKIFDDWIVKYTEESKIILRKHIPSIMDGMTTAYADLFTEQELLDILAFVETPTGKQFFDRMPEVVSSASFAKANQAYMDETMASMIPAQRELLDQLRAHQENKAKPAETT